MAKVVSYSSISDVGSRVANQDVSAGQIDTGWQKNPNQPRPCQYFSEKPPEPTSEGPAEPAAI